MFKHIVFRVLAALVLLAAISGLASFAFNAGMARGAALNLQVPAAAAGQPVPFYGYYGYGMPFMFHPFMGFGFLGLLVPLFLLFLVFGAFRRMMWSARFGGHPMHMMHRSWGEKGPGETDFVHPMFAEWHRRAHDQKDQPADTTAQK